MPTPNATARVVPILERTRQDLRSDFEASDFVFDLANRDPIAGPGGVIRPLSVEELPSLAGESLAYTLFTIEPCGLNLPHLHPRATEFIYLIRGGMLRTAFVGENGEGAFVNDLEEGMGTFFPQDLIHFQQNFGCEPATYISALNSEDPGVVTISSQLFMVADVHLSSTFEQDMERIRELREGLPIGPAEGQLECLQRCNLVQNGDIAPNGILTASSLRVNPTFMTLAAVISTTMLALML